jgi:hypothetical protein
VAYDYAREKFWQGVGTFSASIRGCRRVFEDGSSGAARSPERTPRTRGPGRKTPRLFSPMKRPGKRFFGFFTAHIRNRNTRRPGHGGMGMTGANEAIPVVDAGAMRCNATYPEHSERMERFFRSETGSSASPHRAVRRPAPRLEAGWASFRAFTEQGHLSAVSIDLDIPPAQIADLADSAAGGVQQQQERLVALVGFRLRMRWTSAAGRMCSAGEWT